jgi:hypothetical protein
MERYERREEEAGGGKKSFARVNASAKKKRREHISLVLDTDAAVRRKLYVRDFSLDCFLCTQHISSSSSSLDIARRVFAHEKEKRNNFLSISSRVHGEHLLLSLI